MDLVAIAGFESYDGSVETSPFWRRVGARLLLQRIQEKGWRSYETAKLHTKIDTKTMQKIETGATNVEVGKYQDYAVGVGLSLERVIAEVVAVRRTDLTLAQRALLAALEDSTDRRRQEMLRLMAEPYLEVVAQQDAARAESLEQQTAGATSTSVSSTGTSEKRRKSRNR